MSHPSPTSAEPTLFTSGSYGADFLDSGDSGIAPSQGWCILQCVTTTVIGAATFGSDSSGATKLIGVSLPAGTFVWIQIASITITSGLVALYRGKHQP